MCVDGRVSSLLLRDRPIVSNSVQRIAIYTGKATRADVKTLISREVLDRVVKAEEAVAHGEKLHPIQIKLATWTLVSNSHRLRTISGSKAENKRQREC